MSKQQVRIEDLRLGMYVVELDRPWLGTRFAFQGFPLTSSDQIEELRACCKSVYVDPEREKWTPAARAAGPLKGNADYADLRPVEDELPIARDVYRTCENALRQLQKTLSENGVLDAESLRVAVANVATSIQRNADAMLLLSTLRGKDDYELARAMDVAILMITFGRFLRFETGRLETLGLAGMLLDVGISRLPREIAAIASSLPDDDPRVHPHVAHSVELVRGAPALPRGVDAIVALHHEREDGTGYPRGVAGDAISIDGAMAAIVDAFVALTSARAPGERLSPSNALGHLHKLRGTRYHAALVEQFIQCIGIYPVGSAVELNSGEIGVVVAQNLARRLQPRVMILFDARGALTRPLRMLDLIREPKTASGEPYRIKRALPKDRIPVDAAELFF